MDRTHVGVDLNAADRNGWIRAGFEDAAGHVSRSELVTVYETSEHLLGTARVADVDYEASLIYLDVDWDSIGEYEPGTLHIARAIGHRPAAHGSTQGDTQTVTALVRT